MIQCEVRAQSWTFYSEPLSLPRPLHLVHSFLAPGTNAPLVLWASRGCRRTTPEERCFPLPSHYKSADSLRRIRSWDCKHERRRTQCPTGPRPLPSYNHTGPATFVDDGCTVCFLLSFFHFHFFLSYSTFSISLSLARLLHALTNKNVFGNK